MRWLYALGVAYLGLAAGLVTSDVWVKHRGVELESVSHAQPTGDDPATVSGTSARDWFRRSRPRCNALEAAVAIKRNPPPAGRDGVAYAAACHAVAGRIDEARSLILTLPPEDRPHAAGILFRIGHPIADQGDDESAGPIMELVLEFKPGNFMALYHAGMSEFILGRYEQSGAHLRRFLELYQKNDGWRHNAEKVLRRLAEKERA